MQIFIHCKATLHVSGVTAPIIRSIKNCTRSLRYRSYYLYRYSPPTWSDRDAVPIRPLLLDTCFSYSLMSNGQDYFESCNKNIFQYNCNIYCSLDLKNKLHLSSINMENSVCLYIQWHAARSDIKHAIESNFPFLWSTYYWSSYFLFPLALLTNAGHGRLIFEVARSYTRSTTVSKTPLDEWSARRRELYLFNKQHWPETNIHVPSGLEPAIPAVERLQTYALGTAARSSYLEASVPPRDTWEIREIAKSLPWHRGDH